MAVLCAVYWIATVLFTNVQSQTNLVGPITIMEDGVAATRYVMSGYPPDITVSGTSVTLPHELSISPSFCDSCSH